MKSRPDGILINGAHATVRAKINADDVLTIKLEDESSDLGKLIPSSILPDIIFEDENTVAVNKPPFMPTHQSQGHFYDTLANSLAYYYSMQNRPFIFRSVNRLDRNTSGIVLVAKDRLSSSKLSEQMRTNGIHKTYVAILQGDLPANEGRIETYIRRREKSIILREVCEKCEDSKIAVTEYKVITKANGLTLVEASTLTGRTHQLRVHFAHLGAHILGDDLYGEPSPLICRHALHAFRLTFKHPVSNAPIELTAPLAQDMEEIIKENFGKEFTNYGRKQS